MADNIIIIVLSLTIISMFIIIINLKKKIKSAHKLARNSRDILNKALDYVQHLENELSITNKKKRNK
jgi:hypothetical protein